MNKSESIKHLAAALAKAQGEMGGATKDANNPFFKSTYADLSSVIKAIKEPFSKHGLSYVQYPVFLEGQAGVDTILMHESGEWIESQLLIPIGKKLDAQSVGSVVTYARRYALQAAAGIPSEDDDGNLAAKSSATATDDANEKAWVDLVKKDPAQLDTINDHNYRAYIAKLAGIQ